MGGSNGSMLECVGGCAEPRCVEDRSRHRPESGQARDPTREGAADSGELTLTTTRRRIDKAYEFDAVDVSGALVNFAKARERSTGIFRSIKAVPKTGVGDPEQLRVDILASAQLAHQNVVKVHDVFEDRRLLYMVMEQCTGGALLDRILIDHSLSEAYVARVAHQVLCALGHCHERGVVHLDLNPDCCTFLDAQDSSPLKVSGFGLASRYTPEFIARNGTSAVYCAPELRPQGPGGRATPKPGGSAGSEAAADIWSVGVIAFVLLAGGAPFNMGVAREKAWAVFARHASAGARDFVDQLLREEPRSRPTADECLQHPWLLQHCCGASPSWRDQSAPEALERLKDFRREANFRHAEKAVLVRQMVKEELRRLKELWVSLDHGSSGALSCEQLRIGLQEASMPVPPELQEAFAEAERDPGFDGCPRPLITYTDFVSAMMEYHLRVRCEGTSDIAAGR